MEQELLTLPERLSSPQVVSERQLNRRSCLFFSYIVEYKRGYQT
jgi:hypothetical protein